jgi:hypothetical protein
MDGFLHADGIRRKCVFFSPKHWRPNFSSHKFQSNPSAQPVGFYGMEIIMSSKCFATAMIIGYEKMHLFCYINYELCRLLNVVTQLISFLNMYIILYSLK